MLWRRRYAAAVRGSRYCASTLAAFASVSAARSRASSYQPPPGPSDAAENASSRSRSGSDDGADHRDDDCCVHRVRSIAPSDRDPVARLQAPEGHPDEFGSPGSAALPHIRGGGRSVRSACRLGIRRRAVDRDRGHRGAPGGPPRDFGGQLFEHGLTCLLDRGLPRPSPEPTERRRAFVPHSSESGPLRGAPRRPLSGGPRSRARHREKTGDDGPPTSPGVSSR